MSSIDGTAPSRPIDVAMDDTRPAKQTIRNLWADDVSTYYQRLTSEIGPVYLTLSGASGRDIELLIERGLIQTTETGAIAPVSQNHVVAVERSPQAVIHLQRRFPGLKIEERDFNDLIVGKTLLRYPVTHHKELCRSCVINLDLQEQLKVDHEDGEPIFPILNWAKKLALLHKESPIREWGLYLTLNSDINWSEAVSVSLTTFLADNFSHSPKFSADCKSLLGDQLHDAIIRKEPVTYSALPANTKQRLLMAFVPKKLCELISEQGWVMNTLHNLHYGGEDNRAHMVTWMFRFVWSGHGPNQPNATYLTNVEGILLNAAQIDKDGSLIQVKN